MAKIFKFFAGIRCRNSQPNQSCSEAAENRHCTGQAGERFADVQDISGNPFQPAAAALDRAANASKCRLADAGEILQLALDGLQAFKGYGLFNCHLFTSTSY